MQREGVQVGQREGGQVRGVEEIVGGGDAGVHGGRVVVGRDPFGDDGGEDAAGAVRMEAV